MKKYYRVKSLYIAGIVTVSVWIAGILCIGVYAAREQLAMQRDIAASMVRFHVRANSDTEMDQNLKLAVRDHVIALMAEPLEQSEDLEEAKQILQKYIPAITAAARETLAEAGCNLPVTAYFEKTFFPTRTYGDVTLPPGIYEAFRVDIGAAQGHNWWCVLYPPLCFVDETHGELPETSKQELQHVLTDEEYRLITEYRAAMEDESSAQDRMVQNPAMNEPVKIRFRFLTFLNRE